MPIWLRNTLIVLAGIVLALGSLVFIVSRPLPADAVALAALVSSETVQVENTAAFISFIPKLKDSSQKGLIFYPGARVAPEAYSVGLKAVAETGIKVWNVKMPLNFAVFDSKAADKIIAAHPEITSWAIAGHSLGGAMACSYAKDSSKINTLIFWAAYCDKSFDLSNNSSIQVVSISGDQDGLATPEKVAATKAFAPSSTKYIVIKGMNHAQFGAYGEQSGDNPAKISSADATKAVIAATLEALR